jgi:hypothetical protein
MTDRRAALFQAGASAAATALGTSGLYICPLCGKSFDEFALQRKELTLEHVPPKSFGGRKIILTCRTCNNTAGHKIDAEASRRTALEGFARVVLGGEPGDGGRVIMTWGNEAIVADLSLKQDGTTALNVIGKRNDPARLRRAEEFMRKLAAEGRTDGYTFQITSFHRFNPRFASVSDLRSAFLACSAKFGYRYALHPTLNIIRKQIANPAEELLPRWTTKLGDGTTKGLILFDAHGIVVVTFSERSVVLPWPTKPIQHFTEILKRAASQRVDLTGGNVVAWPLSFEAVLDRRTSSSQTSGAAELAQAISPDVRSVVTGGE